jgi:uncharacterized membrane protein YfcA
MNAIAGGGTLITFPALIAAGLPPLIANATSTVALVPGALTSMLGYRRELAGARRWALALTFPSLLGGALGAWLLLHTPGATFGHVVPWLVLGATALFVAQRPLLAFIRMTRAQSVGLRQPESTQQLPTSTPAGQPEASPRQSSQSDDAGLTAAGPTLPLLGWQFLVGIYGGYFGAGVGILMLAALGFMGFTNLHRMNGLKNWGGFCMNVIAAASFALNGIVEWRIALTMAVAAMAGGYLGSRAAQRVPQHLVRTAVAIVGTASGIWLLRRA